MKLQVPIIVRLAEKVLPVGEITQLVPGAIIEFNKTVGENLDLMINNKLIGNGQAVKVGEKFGLKITQLGSLQEMIKAMGQ
jgi:flagellar motor switch protein FliN/FliY